MKIALTGSSGLIGQSVQAAAHKRGWAVMPVRRLTGTSDHAAGSMNSADGADGLWADYSSGTVHGDWSDVAAVVHLAGAGIADQRWSAARKDVLRSSRIATTAAIARHLATLPRPVPLIMASGAGAYGDTGDTWADENSGFGSNFLADVCRDWEAAAEPARAAKVPVWAVRLPMVLATNGGALDKMLPPIRWGVGGPLGGGSQWVSWAALCDVTRLMLDLVDTSTADADSGGVVNAVAAHVPTQKDMTSIFAAQLKRPAFMPVPAFAVKLLFGQMGEELLLANSRVRSLHLNTLTAWHYHELDEWARDSL